MLDFKGAPDFAMLKKIDGTIETQQQTGTISATEESKKDTKLVANSSNMVISKGKFGIALATTAAISAAVMFSVGNIKKGKLLSEMQNLREAQSSTQLQETLKNLRSAQRNLQELQEKQDIDKKTITELQEKITKLIEESITPKESPEAIQEIENFASEYRRLIDNITSIYEDAIPPQYHHQSIFRRIKTIPFEKSTMEIKPKRKDNFVLGLLSDLKTKGRAKTNLVKSSSTPEQIQEACLDTKMLKNLGVFEDTNIELTYGEKVGWSEEKIARDILQNFYDGNNHTLDGVGMLVEKTGDGYKIRISGNGVFKHERLLRFGNTTKDDDLFEAGGFGEGAKIVYTNLLAKGKVPQIRYRSADWELVFDSAEGVIRKKVSKTPEILDGNYIEFEAKDESLAENIIKAFNYFRHGKNVDFQDLTYDSPDFGFRILEPGQQGNFYLTQRFEYGKSGAWEDGVDGLDIIFKRKPEADLYEQVAGKEFNTGRDRGKMDESDIFELTKCFAKDMSDDDLLQAILATQKHWKNFGTVNKINNPLFGDVLNQKESKSILEFLKALCETAEKRKLGIDFSNAKICVCDNPNLNVKMLKTLGWEVVDAKDCGLDYIGMPTASRIFRQLSEHKSIPPTPKEAKKLKVLEEAIKVIQENFELTYLDKFKQLFKKLSPEDFPVGCCIDKSDYPEEFLNSIPSSIMEKSADRCVEIFDTKKFQQALYDYYSQVIKKMKPEELNNKNCKEIIDTIMNSFNLVEMCKNPITRQIYFQLKDLEIISKADVTAPRFIFDRKAEIADATLGEAIIDLFKGYKGHWIDKTHLNESNFYDLVATYIHEICHKSGEDGSAEFTYKLTDIIESLLTVSAKSPEYRTKLLALQKVFEEIK